MDEQKSRDLLWEVMADCHDEEERFWSIFYALAEEGLNFPLRARALGELVDVVDLDGARSGVRHGVVALVRKGNQEYSVSLAELEFLELDPVSADWLEMYRYWLRLR